MVNSLNITARNRLGNKSLSIGSFPSETASIAYTGELLPAGTASYGSELWSNLTPNFRVYRTATENVQYVSTESVTIGKTYLVTVNITNSVGTIQLYPSTGGVTVSNVSIPAGIVGAYSVILTATATGVLRWIGANTGSDMTISTISVKEVLINPNMRWYKNFGTTKTPALAEGGQGKMFNGNSQYINTGIIPNQAEGTLVTRFTYVTGQVSRCIIGTSEISIWVNASGKIEGLFVDAVITSNDVLVNGRSYHIELPYLGLDASIKVDNVTKASGTASSFTPTLPLFIGARNNSGTADRYFNNVIDETYYYDVALTDTQIQSLYLYPEKVKSYNGAIVPDIGSEANCKLFLPLCENSGSNVYNVAVNPATSIALTNYTTAMHTSAAKLSYGAQCTAWKRDSLGVLLGMSNGLSFDGGVSVKQVTTEYTPTLTDSFAVAVTLAKNNSIQRDSGAIGTVLFRKSVTNTVVPYVFSQTATASAVQTEDYARYAISYNGTTKLFSFYKNGVLVSSSSVIASVVGSAVSFGQTDLGAEAYYRIYKPSQITKFDPVKDYQASLKYVAKLGA